MAIVIRVNVFMTIEILQAHSSPENFQEKNNMSVKTILKSVIYFLISLNFKNKCAVFVHSFLVPTTPKNGAIQI